MNPIRWLGWLIPRAEREYILGDLLETHGSKPFGLGWGIIRVGLALRLSHESPLTSHVSPLTKRSNLVATLLTDLRFALRQLARSPGFSLLAVLTLALGIGATTAIYSVVSPVLFRPLPYPGAERIMTLWERGKDDSESNTGYATFLDVERMSASFESLAAMSSWQPTLQGNGDPERLSRSNDIVSLRENLERTLDVGSVEVRDQEDDRLLRQRARKVARDARDIGAFPSRLERENVSKNTQHVFATLARRQHVLDAIGEQQNSDAIVVAHGGHREHCSKLARELTLEPAHRSEALRA